MIRHLSEEQISAVVAGEKNAGSVSHLRTCAHCRQQVDRLQDVLGGFRCAVREWSDLQPVVSVAGGSRTRMWAVLRLCGMALTILLGALFYRSSSAPAHKAPVVSSAVNVDSDALLLDHVRADVARSTPPGMEALLGFGSAETTQR